MSDELRSLAGGPAGSGLSPEAQQLLTLALGSDVDGALAFAEDLLEHGLTPERLLGEVVVDVQREVGRRWSIDELSVAAEHAATGVIDALVGQLAWRTDRPLDATAGRVVVVCAEGEWHALSARLIADRLRRGGWATTLLGVSVPAAHLARQAEQEPWSAAVLSCTVAMNLPGAARSAAALRSAGVPVLATGWAFGTDERRAMAIGACGWAADPVAGARVLERWRRSPPTPTDPPPAPEALRLAAAATDVVDAAMGELERAWPQTRSYTDVQRRRTREDLAYLLRFLEAAVLTDDPTVLTDYLDWLEPVLVSRGVPAAVIGVTVRAVQRAVPAELRRAHDLLLEAAVEG